LYRNVAQANSLTAADLRRALRAVATVLATGATTHPPNASNHWLRLRPRDHVVHALAHGEKYLLGINHGEDDLAALAARALLALELRERAAERTTQGTDAVSALSKTKHSAEQEIS